LRRRLSLSDNLIRLLVKIGTTAAQRKLFFGFRRAMNKLGGDRAGLTQEVAEAVARELVVPVREVIEMSSRLTGDVFPECARQR
jgi:RNA polymerase sigma-32 factor